MLVLTIFIFSIFSLYFSFYETIKTFSKVYVLMSYKFRMLKCVSCYLQFSKKSHKRRKLRASYSADGDGKAIIIWCTCLRWGLHKVSAQGVQAGHLVCSQSKRDLLLAWGFKCQIPSYKCIFLMYYGHNLSQGPGFDAEVLLRPWIQSPCRCAASIIEATVWFSPHLDLQRILNVAIRLSDFHRKPWIESNIPNVSF